jgi:hypothetical protein
MTRRAALAPESLTDPVVASTRRAALWALRLGALSVALHAVRVINLPGARAARHDASARQVVLDSPAVTIDDVTLSLSGIAFLAAGIFACIWLVRAYREGGAWDATLKPVSDNWLWVMWLVPVVMWISPVLRIRGLLRAANVSGPRGWLVYLWAAVWMPVDFFQRSYRAPLLEAGDGATALWTVGFGVAFALWAALVITINRALDRQLAAPALEQALSTGVQDGAGGPS